MRKSVRLPRATAGTTARVAHARQARQRPAGRGGVDLRAEMGRVSDAGVQGRHRAALAEPRREAAQSLFPRARGALEAALPERIVLDGELVVAQNDALDFDALQMRLHP